MKKLSLLLVAIFALGLSSSQAAWNNKYPDFRSWNKPISGKMASPDEMAKYESDLNDYLEQLDAEIAKIEEKKVQAITQFNAIASDYNHDDFFHKGKSKIKLKKLPKEKREKDQDGPFVIVIK